MDSIMPECTAFLDNVYVITKPGLLKINYGMHITTYSSDPF